MSTHNIGFYEEISKIITFKLSSNIIKYAHGLTCISSADHEYTTLSVSDKIFTTVSVPQPDEPRVVREPVLEVSDLV